MTGCHEIPRGKLRLTWGPSPAGGRSNQPAAGNNGGHAVRCERLETTDPHNGTRRGIKQCEADAELRIRSAAKTTIGHFCRRHATDLPRYAGWTQERL